MGLRSRRALGILGANPTPNNYPSLSNSVAAWLAEDIVLTNNDPVSSWADRIGSVALTNTSTARPTYKSTGMGVLSQPYVDFDGSDDVLYVANTLSTATQGCVVAVVIVDTASAGRGVWSSADESGAAQYFVGAASLGSAPGKITLEQANTLILAQMNGSTSLSTATMYVLEWSSTGTAYELRVNNSVETKTAISGSDNGNWFGDTPFRDSFAMGALKFSGTAAAFFDGGIGYLGVFDAQLSGGDRTALYQWITDTYG